MNQYHENKKYQPLGIRYIKMSYTKRLAHTIKHIKEITRQYLGLFYVTLRQ